MTIDLRSDTVTLPTPGMLDAMMNARVGDDVFGEDETIKALEERTAALFGQEAGLYCPSGTMTNQVAIKVHTRPGDEVICDKLSHVYNYEGGGIAFHSGCSARLMEGDLGRFTASDVLAAVSPDDVHYPRTSLVCIENTCNRGGGSLWELKAIKEIRKVCQEKSLKLHLDGARIFNAIVASGISAASFGEQFDSISVCFSKGLGAPVGSVLLGSQAFIKESKRVRKVMGGGMRQAGILAAACIYALDHHIERLEEDHQRAVRLEQVLKEVPYISEVLPVYTNVVVFRMPEQVPAEEVLKALADKGIKVVTFGRQALRMVTHLGINDEMIDKTCEVLRKIKF